jgi:hypothetical protein
MKGIDSSFQKKLERVACLHIYWKVEEEFGTLTPVTFSATCCIPYMTAGIETLPPNIVILFCQQSQSIWTNPPLSGIANPFGSLAGSTKSF